MYPGSMNESQATTNKIGRSSPYSRVSNCYTKSNERTTARYNEQLQLSTIRVTGLNRFQVNSEHITPGCCIYMFDPYTGIHNVCVCNLGGNTNFIMRK